MGKIIGIDLGTTTSEIAYLKNGKPEIIINKDGDRITPSVVAFNKENEIIVGKKAKRQMAGRQVKEVKRLMGTSEKIFLGEKEFLPQQISAIILKYLKECAEEFLGEEVVEAVITVPAKFDNLQRQATKDAAEIAGLKVERLINEPTAAALAYGLENIGKEEKVLVYDLGGGTFDVSILEMFEGVLEVRASRGNNRLGGKDFDERLMNYIFDEFYRKHEIDLRKNAFAVQAVKEAAENAKIELSHSEYTDIIIPFIPSVMNFDGSPIGIDMSITRKQFEMMIADLVESTDDIINEALKASGLTDEDIDVVLAVGGSTRVPCVKKLLRNRFGSKLKHDINPDEVVALGAAVQAGIKYGLFDSENEILTTTTCSHSLGISTVVYMGGGFVPGVFDILIPIDSTIPVTKKNIYQTVHDYQEIVKIEVFEGEETLTSLNTKIGEFELEGIPPAPAGEQSIEVAFSYDINSILQVDATILSTGKKITKIFNLKSMSLEEIEDAKADLDKAWKDSIFSQRCKIIIEVAEKKIPALPQAEKVKVENLLNKLKMAITEGDEELIEKYDTELTDLLFEL